jgi:hypothetical protein
MVIDMQDIAEQDAELGVVKCRAVEHQFKLLVKTFGSWKKKLGLRLS